jgi:hypothetical protein
MKTGYKGKLAAALTAVLLTVFSVCFTGCGQAPPETSSTAILDYHMYFEVPSFNFFVTPEIERQEKYDKISYTKDWFLAYDADWLEATPKEGKAGEQVLVTITTRNEPKEQGQYKTEIRVESKDHTSYKLIPVTLNIIKDKEGTIYDIPVEQEITDIFDQATMYSHSTVKLERLKGYQSGLGEGLIYNAGDPCIVISTEFTNNTDNQTPLYLSGDGFDKNGVQTSWCISSGPITGLDDFDLPAHQTATVTLLFSWTSTLSRMIIRGKVYDDEMLKPIPATPMPESELTHVWFDEAWFVANDREPDPNDVYITFPARWLETGESDSFNGTGIELHVPKQMLEMDNESQNPDEITVRFPLAYFIGAPGAPATRTP